MRRLVGVLCGLLMFGLAACGPKQVDVEADMPDGTGEGKITQQTMNQDTADLPKDDASEGAK